MKLPRLLPLALAGSAALLMTACGSLSMPGSAPSGLDKVTVYAVTQQNELIKFRAAKPEHILERFALNGLPAGERLVGIDFRVAKGDLYTLSAKGQLYKIDTRNGQLMAVGKAADGARVTGRITGFDFNPAADRIRVVSDNGQNLRLHPDTGALAATDPDLAYAKGDKMEGKPSEIGGAAYTYNKKNDKLTTNYAIDKLWGHLVTQGSVEGAQPAVSPNTGQLFTVGPLGTGSLVDVHFDIADVDNRALVAASTTGDLRPRLHQVDLASGKATAIGVVGQGTPLLGMAIEP